MLLVSIIVGSACILAGLCTYITIKSSGESLNNHVGIHSELGYFDK